MPLNQFTQYRTNVNSVSQIHVTPPIIAGAGMCQFQRGSGTTGNRSIVRVSGPTIDRAYLTGRQRHLFQFDVAPAAGASTSWMGCGCMMSQEDLTGGAGSSYGLILTTGDTLGTITAMRIVKFTAGYAQAGSGGSTILASETGLSIAEGATIAIELRWRFDLAQFGGTAFQAYRGSALDFSDLALKISAQDSSSPLTSSVAEWVGMYAHTGGDSNCYVDQTRLTRRA